MLKVGVIGATGYTGEELVKILVRHKDVSLTVLQAIVEKDLPISRIIPSLAKETDLICKKPDYREASEKADLLFLALPHTVSMNVAPILLKAGSKVIDLSADYRLSVNEYEKWYGTGHKDKSNIKEAVYGLPELFRDKIKRARLIANPGCYPTGASLAIIPLAKDGLIDTKSVIIDAKSGATGAGRKAHISLIFPEVNESIKAYKINEHQHKPEINMVISKAGGEKADVVFVPHLIPVNRGILSTIYMDLSQKGIKKKLRTKNLVALYREFYKGKPFVNVSDVGNFPALKDVQHTNYCNIGVKSQGHRIIAVSCIDNLLKGAAGQAVQNMNIMCGFDEKEGLI
ncbi:MAG: N-acetyl-gamma-glutamyl-phosphate reductase [Candidatus Omnitrophota bacterium]